MRRRSPDARRVTIDGHEVIVLDPEQYERLESARRQQGAQTVQISRLRRDLSDASRRLDAVRRVLAATGDCDGAPGCVHCAVRSALESGPG